MGRSNVGKSSLINRLLGRTRSPIARVSVRPGKTQEINFYRVRAALEAEPGSGLPPREPSIQEPELKGDNAGATTDRRRVDPVLERGPTAGAQRYGVERDLAFFLVDLPGYSFARVPAAVRARWKPLIESYLSSGRALRGVIQLIDARHKPTADDRTMVHYLAALNVPTLFALTKIDKLTRSQRRLRVSDAAEELDVDSEQIVPFSAATGEGRELLLDSIAELLLRPKPRREHGEATY